MATIEKENLQVKGMTCKSCEKIIKKDISSMEGVIEIELSYETGKGFVKFDSSKISLETINKKIEDLGYNNSNNTQENTNNKLTDNVKENWFGYLILVVGVLILGYFLLPFISNIHIPEISQNMGYGLLLVLGLLTGFHCVAMCGGFVVSYTAKNAKAGKKSYQSHLAYGIGKTISYTIIGAGFGFIGSIITFTPLIRGIAGILSGLFLIIFGLNMFDILPFFRKFRLTTPKFISKYIGEKNGEQSSPLVIGLLNGLMIACGPLQAIYIMAAGTGSTIEGAKMLFVFALGTLPVMLGFGYLTTILSSKISHKLLKISGIVVIILGIIMLNRGLALTGTGYDVTSVFASSTNQITGDSILNTNIKNGYQEIKMDVLSSGWSPNKFVLKKGVPVKWVINGKELTGCNNAIQVPKLNLEFKIKPGLQTIEFTPKEEGIIPFSCWMGMIQGTFIVKENIDLSNTADVEKELNSAPTQKAASCGGSGGCGCGG